MFNGCKDLKEVTLPDGVEKIGNNAFNSCVDLKEITIPDKVTEIGYTAFSKSGLTSINLPENLKTIGFDAFWSCNNLTRIVLSGATPPILDINVFYYAPSPRYMVLTGAAATSGKYDEGWQGFTKTKTLEDEVTLPSIPDQTYTGSALEPDIDIPGTKDTDYKVTCENNTNAGQATVTITTDGCYGMYTGAASATFTINPAPGSAQVDLDSWTYGQAGNRPVPASETNGTENVTYAYKTKGAGDDTYQAEKPTAAGQYTVQASFAAVQNYEAVTATADFTIEKAQPVLTIAPEAGKEIQVGEPVTLNIALKGVKDETPEGTVAILGKNLTLKAGQATVVYTPADDTPKTLTAIYTPAEGENYTSAQANTTLEAGKKTREPIVVNAAAKTYGDPDFTLTPTGGSLQPGEAYTYTSDNEAVAGVKADGTVTITGVGTAHITVSIVESSVWNPAEAVMPLVVAKATPAYDIPNLTAVYGQTLKDVTLPEGFSWQDDESTAVGNAGSNTFKATYTPEDTANYQTMADIEVSIEVSKATPVYELPKDLTAVYGQTLKDVALPAGFSWQDDESTAVGNAGSNTFKATYTPADTANYQTVADIEVTITVSKGESTLVVQADKTQFTYGEAFTLTVDVDLKPQSRSLTRAAADTVDVYLGDPADNRQLATAAVENSKATATIEQSNPNYPNGGSADITIVYNGSGSLNKSIGSLHLDITPATGSAQVSQAGWTYGQTGDRPVPVSETNGTENVTYAYKTKGADDSTYQAEKPTAVGQYTLRATFAATQNYKAVTATADFAIEKAQPVMTMTPEAGKEIQVGEPVTLNIALKGVKDETPEGTVAILGKNLTLKDGQASIAYTPADTKPVTLTAAYTPAEGENYTGTQASLTLTAGKKTRAPIILEDSTKTYGDPAFTLTPTGGSLQEGESYQYASDNAAVATVDQNGEVTLHQAGTAHITVSVAESSAWNPAAATMTLTVDKAKITGVSFEDAAFTEDGAEHKIELTGSLPEGTSVSYENNVQKAPGTYTAKAIIDGGVNYESLELTAVLTINEKPADPTPGQPTPTPGTGSDTTSNPAPENTTNNTTENTTERTTDNTNTGLAGSGTTAVAAVLLSLLALTGLVLWQKSKKQ